MKNLYLVLLFLSISLSISDDCLTLDDHLTGGETVEKCDKLVVPSEYKKCCLLSFTYQGQSGKACLAITEEEIKDRDKAYKRLTGKYNGSTGTIKCVGDTEESGSNSALIKLSLFSLLLILL